jgi:D-xylose 1-dehydrogenase (NADP+, D-xylono-1,5-lactone-forming)
MLDWGIIGAGRIARKFAAGLRESQAGQLVAVASRDTLRAQTIAQELGAPIGHGSYEALLADPRVHAVYIALPNSMHAEWAIKAAQAGKHILCEKPLAPTRAEAEAMFEAAREHQVWLMEAFMYRFHPRTRALQELISAGAIGQIRLIRAGFSFSLDRPGDIRWDAALAGGALYDIGCYPLNLARALIGSAPNRAWASAQWAESGIDHTLAATLEYPGGAIAQLLCSFRASFQQQVQIVGSDGVIELDQAFTMHPHQDTHIRLWRGNHFAELERIEIAATNHYRLEADAFAQLVQSGHAVAGLPEMPLQETLDNLATIEALLASARSQQVVTIS